MRIRRSLPADIRRAFRLDLGRGRAPAREAELDDEIRFHLEQRVAELVGKGWSRERAETEAIARFGPYQESRNQLLDAARSRDEVLTMVDRFVALRSLPSDLRYAVRRMRSRLGFTLIALLSVGLGIGANTAAFSLINAIVLHKTPLSHPERVVEIYAEQRGQLSGPMSYPDYLDLRTQSTGVFRYVSVSKLTMVARDMGNHVESEMAELVNGDYFGLLGLPPEAGRLLGPEDDVAKGAHPVVVLSSAYWHRAFNADPRVVGREIRLGGRAYTIVGVASKDIQGLIPGLAAAIFAPVQMAKQLDVTGDDLALRGGRAYFARARLADGQSLAAARAVVARFVGQMQKSYPTNWSAATSLRVIPFERVVVNPMIDSVVAPAVSALMIVVMLVLVVACTNLASFLLAQSRDRQREIAIRLAIGATRSAIVRQLLAESLTLALLGGALGLAIGMTALRALLHANLPVPLPITLNAELDARVLVFTIGISVLAGLLFGLLPALKTTSPRVVDAMRRDTTHGRPGRRVTLRNGLVIAQTTISVVLLVAAGLFLRSFAAQSNVDPGFGTKPAGMVWMVIPPDRYPGDRSSLMLGEIERAIRALPDVDGVGVIDNMMLNARGTQSGTTINVAGFQPSKGETGFGVFSASADSGFFDAVGMTILAGRGFRSTDKRGAPRVAVINETVAKKFWHDQNPIGQTFRSDTTTYRIVGVSRNTKVNSLGERPRPFVFFAIDQAAPADFMLVGRTRGSDELATNRMLATLHDLDPSLMILQTNTMSRHLAANVLPARLGAVAFALFAALALVLALIGVYGVVRYAVSRRTREVAIRLAVGAAPQSLVRLLMSEGLVLVAIGTVLGLTIGLALGRALQALLYGVKGVEPISMFGAPALLLGVGALAAFLPARRASRVDPAITLRAE